MKYIARLFGARNDTPLTIVGLQLSVLLVIANISTPVQAETVLTGVYTGVRFSDSEVILESASGGGEASESNGHFKYILGKRLTSVFSVEGQLGLTADSNDESGIVTYGGYLRAEYDFDECRLFGLLGVGGINAYNDVASDVSESSASYGIGLELFGTKTVALTFEYMSMLDTDWDGRDLTMESIGFGFTYYFNEDNSLVRKNNKSLRNLRQ